VVSARQRTGSPTAIPDVRGAAREGFTGGRVAVVGGGHSAANALLDLAALNAEVAGASTTWVLRRPTAARLVGGGANDKLAARGRLGTDVERLVEEHVIAIERGFRTDGVEVTDVGVLLGDHDRRIGPFDEIVVATGLRPDLDRCARCASTWTRSSRHLARWRR